MMRVYIIYIYEKERERERENNIWIKCRKINEKAERENRESCFAGLHTAAAAAAAAPGSRSRAPRPVTVI